MLSPGSWCFGYRWSCSVLGDCSGESKVWLFLFLFSRGSRGERYLVGSVDMKEEEWGEDKLFLVEQISYRGKKTAGLWGCWDRR